MSSDEGSGGIQGKLSLPGYLPEKSILQPKLNAIFAEVEKNLPTIDFDTSDISSDEEVGIFQRSIKKPTLDLEDLHDEKDIDESELSDGFEALNPVNNTDQKVGDIDIDLLGRLDKRLQEEWSRDVPKQRPFSAPAANGDHINQNELVKNKINDSAKASINVSSPPNPMLQNWTIEANETTIEANELTNEANESPNVNEKSTSIGVSSNELWDENQNKKYHAQEKAKKKAQKSKRDEVIMSKLLPKENTVLSLQGLDSLDIDLPSVTPQSFQLDETLGGGEVGASRAKEPSIEQGSILQQLAELSMKQSGKEINSIDPKTGAIKKKPLPPKATKTTRNKNQSTKPDVRKQTCSMGTNTNDLPTPPTPSSRPEVHKTPQPDTVYMDLRNFDKNRQKEQMNSDAITRILKLQEPSGSVSSDSDSDDEDWREQRLHLKQKLSKDNKNHGQDTACKQPKQHRPVPKRPPMLSPRTPLTVVTPNNAPPPNKNLSGTGTPPNTPTETKDNITDEQKQTELEMALEREKKRRFEIAQKLRAERDHERQSRMRLSKRLEALRPSTSVRGKQPSGEATPTLFNVECSYEPAPLPLPNVLADSTELTLLTVYLASNGHMTTHRGSGNKPLDPALGMSASYQSLITWLLTLVPDNFDTFSTGTGDIVLSCPAPFHVLGLQQVCLEDQLCLQVAVAPNQQYMALTQKQKKLKGGGKGGQFQQLLSKFLSGSTLQSTCPWLAALVSTNLTPAGSSPSHSFTYRPPLPNITTKPLSTFIQINPDSTAVRKTFGANVGFFWQTIENEEAFFDNNMELDSVGYETQNTMSLIYKKVYKDPTATMGILNRALQEGLDLAGVRLLYPTQSVLNAANPSNQSPTSNDNQSDLDTLNKIGPILAIALRGTFARSLWLDALGPSDPQLARRTDPNSLCALYGGKHRDECLIFSPRNPSRVQSELCRWFGGRVPANGVIDVGTTTSSKQRHRSGSPSSKGLIKKQLELPEPEVKISINRPPATLTATTSGDVFVAISPLVPVKCLGVILATCQRRGYQLRGVRRLKLSSKRANSLGIPNVYTHVYCPGSDSKPTSPRSPDALSPPDALHSRHRCPTTLLLLHKENAMHNCGGLLENFMLQMSLQAILGEIQQSTDQPLCTGLLFHATPYSDSQLHALGGDFSKVPEHDQIRSPGYIAPKLHTNPEMEQTVCLTLTGHLLMKTFGLYLGKLLNLVPCSKAPYPMPFSEGFELLAIKWLPGLSSTQAKELTPYEVGNKQWKPSIHQLTSEPAVILAVRGINAFQRLENYILSKPGGLKGQSLDKLMSVTPELAYRQITMFFQSWELFSDPQARSLLPYLPPPRYALTIEDSLSPRARKTRSKTSVKDTSHANLEDNILDSLVYGPRPLTTTLVIKPVAVHKHLAKILRRLTLEGFTLAAVRLTMLDTQQASHLVPIQDKQNEVLMKMHIEHLTSGPCMLLCVQRENAVKKLLDLIGPVDPLVARRTNSLLWRGLFGTDTVSNALYASSSYIRAVEDERLFFPDGLTCSPTPELTADQIHCSVEDVVTGSSPSRGVATHTDSTDVVRSLMQTNCVLLAPPLFKKEKRSRNFALADILEGLLTHGFEVVGCRMIVLSEPQAQEYQHLMGTGDFSLTPILTSGPSLVLAVQRDNAVVSFDSHLGATYQSDSVNAKYGQHLLRPKSVTQAHKHLAFFFDELLPGAQVSITK
ncbi:unnamed protein product [Owenia fusiformis]|uniref:Nucleoside diphosphate kinase-like domain-containing protein n=1 Tax=Owenia fusiformis TaxID=6347 RepID=A0A8S4PNL1_OWEFU|nr:unnamed protein product [Owenia fusiformis]CAH1795910.1 unnamed protein product [Owenia fusiformis]